jgi:hypothetical protein
MAIRETQRNLYALFQEFAKSGKRLTVPVILERTGSKPQQGLAQRTLPEACKEAMS